MKNEMKKVIGTVVRTVFSSLPQVLFNDTLFENGVTFNIITRNDPWFLESLLSILDLADEIIIIDSSDELYKNYNKKIVDQLRSEKIQYFCQDLNIREAREVAKNKTTKEIICHWDADMIATVDGRDSLKNLFSHLSKRRGKTVVYFPIVTFFSNIRTILTEPYHSEGWVYSNSNKGFYKPRVENAKTGEFVEGFKPPIYFRKLEIKKPLAMHMSLMMPRDKLIQKYLQKLWLNDDYKKKYQTFSELVSDLKGTVKIDADYNTEPYSIERFGQYPKWLQRFIDSEYMDIIELKMKEIKTLEIPFL